MTDFSKVFAIGLWIVEAQLKIKATKLCNIRRHLTQTLFVACQCDIYMGFLSVRPSVRLMLLLCRNDYIHRERFVHLIVVITSVSRPF